MKYKVLLIGSGAREHSIAWRLNKSPLLNKLFCIPGNPGIAQIAKCHPIQIEDFLSIKKFIEEHEIDLLFCGPEAPLADGLMDYLSEELQTKTILIGPKKKGALLESSKKFAKEFMYKYDIPTAKYQAFNSTELNKAIEYIKLMTPPIVLKADGLAAGKGVLISPTHEQAISEIEMMLKGKFGDASKEVVIEEFLSGIEFSCFVLTNGTQYVILPDAKDYKKIGEADLGLNTGGMGSISPVDFVDIELKEKIIQRIVNPTLYGLQNEQIDYQGFIFIGLIIVENDPYVIEYNCRLGDPETESIMLRLDSDLIELLVACDNHTLDNYSLVINKQYAATIFLVSGGYPEEFEKGKVISNIPHDTPSSFIFHAATKQVEKQLVTNGGRVISISSLGSSKEDALQKSIEIANQIKYDGKYFRKDIGFDL